ncbi:MAG: hypothetical protein A4E35_01848 [Methanoregula sp. PtaU1.Bin051]|nr:MAG: hypothetical protein A4E35_01848 [Methanoregula sp. PtaU1.Bin051]
MDGKKVLTAGIGGGIVFFILLFGLNVIMNATIGYDIAAFGGMRPNNDPLMLLFFAYPFVMAFAVAWAYDLISSCLTGTGTRKGITFGILLIILIALPSNFAMFTSMNWPVSFYIGNLITAVVGYPILGVLFTRIWDV